MKTLLIVIASFVAVSCNFVDDNYSIIPPNVRPHVNEFIRQAKQRGIDVDVSTLKVEFIGYNDFTAGDASRENETIRIDTTTEVWGINPESLIFHEMGHLYLGLGHDDSMVDGYQKSIMNSSCVLYWPAVREYYIEELFNPNTKPPTKWD